MARDAGLAQTTAAPMNYGGAENIGPMTLPGVNKHELLT